MSTDSVQPAMSVAMDLFKAGHKLAAALVYAELAQGGASSAELWCGLGAALLGCRGLFVRKPFEVWAAKVFARGAPAFVGTAYAEVVKELGAAEKSVHDVGVADVDSEQAGHRTDQCSSEPPGRSSLAGLPRRLPAVWPARRMLQPSTDAARILVVDDEKVIREILTEFLTMEGYQVGAAEDGQKALDELAKLPASVAFPAKLGFDVRTGAPLKVTTARDYVLGQSEAPRFLDTYETLLSLVIDGYRREGKRYVTIGVGCTGGKHRSVYLAEKLTQHFRQSGRENVLTFHRELE